MSFRSFQGRILTFFLGLFILVQAAAFWAINARLAASARAQIDSQLEVGAGVFRRLLDTRTQRLLESARLLSGDFAFKSVAATGDAETILSALGNHRARIGADVMILASLDYRVIADTLHPGVSGASLPFAGILEKAVESGEGEIATIVFIDGRPYQMVVVPLLAPVPSAWIGTGFLIDDPFAEDLRRLTLSHVSLLRDEGGSTWTPFASTLPPDRARALPARLAASSWKENSSLTLDLDGEDFVTQVAPLGGGTAAGAGTGSGTEVLAVLQRSLPEALAPYRTLRLLLALLFAGGVALTVVIGTAIARSVSRPVLRLAEAARKVKGGDYSQRIEVTQRDEVGELASSFNELVKALEEKDRVRTLLGKVVSPAVAHELLNRGIELGGEEREVSILFSDVREFTALSESRSPREILSLLNDYLTRMSGVVEANGGVVDKYVGDAMMALFGAPLTQADDPARAVRTALGMTEALRGLNEEFRLKGVSPIRMGIGVNTAEVVAGNMGSTTRLNYTVIGDGVNLASRLEGLTKIYGVPILVSETTKAAAPRFVYREIDRARVKGKSRPVTLYEPLGVEGEVEAPALETLHRYHEALGDFRRREWDRARETLEALNAANPGTRLYEIYLERTAAFVSSPPGPDWDGTHSHMEK